MAKLKVEIDREFVSQGSFDSVVELFSESISKYFEKALLFKILTFPLFIILFSLLLILILYSLIYFPLRTVSLFLISLVQSTQDSSGFLGDVQDIPYVGWLLAIILLIVSYCFLGLIGIALYFLTLAMSIFFYILIFIIYIIKSILNLKDE
jgi:hypothetical protein